MPSYPASAHDHTSRRRRADRGRGETPGALRLRVGPGRTIVLARTEVGRRIQAPGRSSTTRRLPRSRAAHEPSHPACGSVGPVWGRPRLGVDGLCAGLGIGPKGIVLSWGRETVGAKLEDLQFTLGEGPGPDSAVGTPVLAPDLAMMQTHWPAFTSAWYETGAVPPGRALPSERALTGELGAGRTTVRLVLAKLPAAGTPTLESGPIPVRFTPRRSRAVAEFSTRTGVEAPNRHPVTPGNESGCCYSRIRSCSTWVAPTRWSRQSRIRGSRRPRCPGKRPRSSCTTSWCTS